MKKTLTNLWKTALSWIESGDLIFPMVVVSVAHYVGVLSGRDIVLVAAAIGLLVDIGHYRLIKSALKYGGGWWGAAAVMTAIAFGYHFAFYSLAGAWVVEAVLLAIPIPFLIIALAALSVRERWAQKVKPNTEPNPNGSQTVREPVTEQKPKTKRGETKQRILTEHEANPSLTVTELAERTGASKAHVSAVLAQLRERPAKPLGFGPNDGKL